MRAGRGARLVLLVVGLGVGAAVAACPGIAAADPFDFNDLSISIDGYSVYSVGSAFAESGTGSIAIADGADSGAYAGTSSGDHFDSAFAQGTDADAFGGDGSFDSAFAQGTDPYAYAGDGNFDSAFAQGTDAEAYGYEGNFDSADADGTSSIAYSGGDSNVGNGDIADAFGAHTEAASGTFSGGPVSNNDVALVVDPTGTLNSDALAGNGDFDLASVFGDNSSAYAGVDQTVTEFGSYDLAAVFGNALSALDASGGNCLIDILPML